LVAANGGFGKRSAPTYLGGRSKKPNATLLDSLEAKLKATTEKASG